MIENKFVFIAPMFNASEYVGQMLASIVAQSYSNWRVILIDDMSDPEHYEKQRQVIKRWSMVADPHLDHDDLLLTPPAARISWVGNLSKQWEVANVLWGIKMCCSDDDIVCRIDADDYLCDLDALKVLNEVYKLHSPDCLWTAHRWFDDKRLTNMNISAPMPDGSDPYIHPWVSSHLKTFRKKIFNQINDENFRGKDGKYIKRAGDQCLYLPILHNAQKRIYLPMVTYAYRCSMDPANFQTEDAKFQKAEAEFIRARGYVT